MALEGIKNSTYQNNAGQNAKVKSTAGRKNVDMADGSADTFSYNMKTANDLNEDQKEINEKCIKEEITKANTYLKQHNVKCRFDYREEINRIIIKVVDGDTKKVIREIPPEKTLDAVQKMWELAGLLIDERR